MKVFWTGDQGCFCFGSEGLRDIPDLDCAVLAAGHYEAFFQSERNNKVKGKEEKQWLPLQRKKGLLFPCWDLHTVTHAARISNRVL